MLQIAALLQARDPATHPMTHGTVTAAAAAADDDDDDDDDASLSFCLFSLLSVIITSSHKDYNETSQRL